MSKTALAALVLLVACREELPTRFEARCEAVDGPAAGECMIRCAAAANPKSDEEGEDLVRECAKQCSELYCAGTRAPMYWWQGVLRSCRVAPPEAARRCRAHFREDGEPGR